VKVLVTGAGGFIGRPLVDSLLKDGIQVRVLAQASHTLPAAWKNLVEVAIGDLTVAATLVPAVADCEVVYHLAGEVRNHAKMWAVNKEGSEHLVEASHKAGVRRFVYLSSVGVLGSKGGEGRVDEMTPPQPRNLYEESKLAGEAAALCRHAERGLQVKVVRPSIVYGEGRQPRDDSFLRWIRAIRNGQFIMLGRDYMSSYVYIGDVVAACRFVEQSDRTGGQCFIVNEPVSLTCFVDEAARLLGIKAPPVLPRAVGSLAAGLLRLTGRFSSLYNRTLYSMDRLSQLGFNLHYQYPEGLHRTLDWYRSMKYLP